MYVLLARSISIEFSSGESKTKDVEDEEMYEVEKTKEDKNEGLLIIWFSRLFDSIITMFIFAFRIS